MDGCCRKWRFHNLCLYLKFMIISASIGKKINIRSVDGGFLCCKRKVFVLMKEREFVLKTSEVFLCYVITNLQVLAVGKGYHWEIGKHRLVIYSEVTFFMATISESI